jgi:predicted ATPase
MVPCECQLTHARKRIVLTGGPGAGKTAVLELVRQHFCRHVDVLPESASMLLGGGFRRGKTTEGRAAVQRAIFHVQRELETVAAAEANAAITLCDRGTIDGFAYWPGPGDFWVALSTSRAAELARYDAVLHLRTPPAGNGYNHSNPLRLETAEEAAAIDRRIAEAWSGHPRYMVVESTRDFLSKAQTAISLLRAELPDCCRRHVISTGIEARTP